MTNSTKRTFAGLLRLSISPSLFFLIVSVSAGQSFAQNALLSWDAPTTDQGGGPLTGLSGYRVHYGNSTGSYPTVIDVGNVTSYPLTLSPGTYFFVVNAYDPTGNQGPNSSEVSKTIVAQQPTPTATGTSTPTTPPATATRTFTATPTRTATPLPTQTFTSSPTRTFTPTATSTSTSSPTRTPTATLTSTSSPTRTSTPITTATATQTPTRTSTATPTRTSTPTTTGTVSASATPTATRTSTATPTRTSTPTTTRTATASATQSQTPQVTSTSTPSGTATPSTTPTSGAMTPTPSVSPSASATPSPEPTNVAPASPTETPSSGNRRSVNCAPAQDSLSIIPIISGKKLELIDSETGRSHASVSILQDRQSMLGDLDGLSSDSSGLGALDLIAIDRKMVWSASTTTNIPSQKLGRRNSQAMLCHVDKDALVDYSTAEGQRFVSRSSLTGKRFKVSLRKLGEIKALNCGQMNAQSVIDRLVVIHSKARARSNKSAQPKLSVSVLDIETGAVLSTRSINAPSADSILIADIDGDGEAEQCVLTKSGVKSKLICLQQAGEKMVRLPKRLSQIITGNFSRDVDLNKSTQDEFVVLTGNGKLWLVAGDGSRKEILISQDPAGIRLPGKKTLGHCR